MRRSLLFSAVALVISFGGFLAIVPPSKVQAQTPDQAYANLGYPFQVGESWQIVQGYYSKATQGGNSHAKVPSLDLQKNGNSASTNGATVIAAMDGWLDNIGEYWKDGILRGYQLKIWSDKDSNGHGTGFSVQYIHIKNPWDPNVSNGKFVKKGYPLSQTYIYKTGYLPHLDFSLISSTKVYYPFVYGVWNLPKTTDYSACTKLSPTGITAQHCNKWITNNGETQPTPTQFFYRNDRSFHTDVDNDGDTDILAINDNGDLLQSTQNADRTFSSFVTKVTKLVSSTTTWFKTDIHKRIWPIDVDGDKDIDILGIGDNGDVVVSTRNTDGSYTSMQTKKTALLSSVSTWFRTDIHQRIWPLDVDADNDIDFIGISDNGDVLVSTRNADGTFTNMVNKKTALLSSVNTWFKKDIHPRFWAMDLDSDKDIDFLGISDNGDVLVSIRNADGTYSSMQNKKTALLSSVASWFRTDIHARFWPVDIEGDKDKDLLGISDNGDVLVSTRNADGTFTSMLNKRIALVQSINDWARNDAQPRLWPTDVDHDNDIDFLGISNNGDLFVSTRNADGSFGGMVNKKSGLISNFLDWFRKDIHQRIWISDVDGEGDIDLWGINNDGDVLVSTRNNDGTFTSLNTKKLGLITSLTSWFKKDIYPRI